MQFKAEVCNFRATSIRIAKIMTLFKQVFFFRRPLLLCKLTGSHAPKLIPLFEPLLLCVAGQDSQTNREMFFFLHFLQMA